MEKSELDFSGSWKKIRVLGKEKTPTIYLFRHAQTYFNRDRRFTGWKDSRLTPFGKEQAKNIAKKLKGKKIDAAFQTSLSRSRDTLRAVLKFHPECRRRFTDDRMIERSYGKLMGMSHKVYEKTHSADGLQKIRRSYDYPPPGGESIVTVADRVGPFLTELDARFASDPDRTEFVIAHGGSIHALRFLIERWTYKEADRQYDKGLLPNCGMVVYQYLPGTGFVPI